MSMQDYDKAVQLMSEHLDLQDFAGPAAEGTVHQAEQVIGVVFPLTYRRFLMEYGAGHFGSSEIYGVVDEHVTGAEVSDVIRYTLGARKTSQLPAHYVVIHNDGKGSLACLDCSRQGVEAPVVQFTPGSPTNPHEQLASDFGQFLRWLVALELEEEDEAE